MAERIQLISDLQGVVRTCRASALQVDIATLVGRLWGEGGTVSVGSFEEAVNAVPDQDVLLRVEGTSLRFLDSATGTVEYASLEVPPLPA